MPSSFVHFAKLFVMKQYFSCLLLLISLCFFAVSCSDDEEGTEFLFDREIMEMNRHGEQPMSLRNEPAPNGPQFISAVGDDSISRFDSPKKKRSKNRGHKKK